jgi:hypothetical protein
MRNAAFPERTLARRRLTQMGNAGFPERTLGRRCQAWMRKKQDFRQDQGVSPRPDLKLGQVHPTARSKSSCPANCNRFHAFADPEVPRLDISSPILKNEAGPRIPDHDHL